MDISKNQWRSTGGMAKLDIPENIERREKEHFQYPYNVLCMNDEKTFVDPRPLNDILGGLKALCDRLLSPC